MYIPAKSNYNEIITKLARTSDMTNNLKLVG